MRLMLIVLMMALAPLRGWAGDAMAITMVAQQISTMSMSMPHASPASLPVSDARLPQAGAALVGHTDCMAHEAPTQVAVTPHSDGASGDANMLHCPTCSFCQACSSPGLAAMASLFEPVRFVHAVPQSSGTLFTSAERAPGFKPPIS